MARTSKYADWTNAQLILKFARHFYDETKTAAKEEEKILKELAKRKIIDGEEMKKMYEQYYL
jgi:hypothetical protein